MLSRSVVSNSLRPHGLWLARLLCPWDFPGKNIGVDCHALLQGIFLTQGSNPHLLCLLYWQVDSFPLGHLGNLCYIYITHIYNYIYVNKYLGDNIWSES